MENEDLLEELSNGQRKVFEASINLYDEASRIEQLLRINHAVPGKDYTFIDLFKIAAENLKVKELQYIGNGLSGIEYQLDVQNNIEVERK